MNTQAIPPLYRYLNEEFVDLFFKLGLLRISSFEQFKKHKDEARLDKQEGVARLIGNSCDSNTKIEIQFGVSNCFVLCSSSIKSKSLLSIFKTDGCFEIFDPKNFMKAIANAMGKRGYMPHILLRGECCYKPTREILKNIHQSDIDKIKIDDKNHTMDFSALFGLGIQIGYPDILFLKSDDYREQNEYRMVWDIKQQNIPDYIDLYVPEAIQFCRKINL